MTFRDSLIKDPRLTLLVCFACCAAFGIVPFAAWRLWQGQVLVGLIEIVLVAGFLSALWVGWRHKHLHLVSYLAVAFITTGCILLAPMIGRVGLFWGYAILVANLLLTDRKFGFLANLVLIAFMMSFGELFATGFERFSFVVTALLVTVYAYWFAIMTDVQRERLEALATFDELTSAGNRRLMEMELNELFSRPSHAGLPHAIAVLDLDHFKSVNDRYGHEEGDNTLRKATEQLRKVLRRGDILIRWGGEEFLVVMPGTDAAGARVAIERLRAEGLGPRPDGVQQTASIGIAERIADSTADWGDLVEKADQRMYVAKKSGKDRVVTIGDETFF